MMDLVAIPLPWRASCSLLALLLPTTRYEADVSSDLLQRCLLEIGFGSSSMARFFLISLMREVTIPPSCSMESGPILLGISLLLKTAHILFSWLSMEVCSLSLVETNGWPPPFPLSMMESRALLLLSAKLSSSGAPPSIQSARQKVLHIRSLLPVP